MSSRIFQMLGYILLYFAVVSIIAIQFINPHHSSKTGSFMLSAMALFLPFFFLVGRKVFLWKAKNTPAVSIKEIEKYLNEFNVEGLAFSFEESKGEYLLSPFEFSNNMISERTSSKFYIKIWLDDRLNKATFCDYLVQTTKGTNLLFSSFNMAKSYQKGMISMQTGDFSSAEQGFSTAPIHNELIKLFTTHGWDLQGTMF